MIRPVTRPPPTTSSVTPVPRSLSSTSGRLPLPGPSVAIAAFAHARGSSGIEIETARPPERSTTVRLLSRSLT